MGKQNDSAGTDTRPHAAQPVRGYRAWTIKDPWDFSLKGAFGAEWSDNHLVAECLADHRERFRKPEDDTPERKAARQLLAKVHLTQHKCTCGVYGLLDAREAYNHYSGRSDEPAVVAMCVFGGAARIATQNHAGAIQAEQCYIEQMTIIWPGLSDKGKQYITETLSAKGLPFRFVDEMPDDFPVVKLPLVLRRSLRRDTDVPQLLRSLRYLSTTSGKTWGRTYWKHEGIVDKRWPPPVRSRHGNYVTFANKFLRVWDRLHPRNVAGNRPPSQLSAVGNNQCACGCGGRTNRNFQPGHDARAYNWLKKVQLGTMAEEDLPDTLRQGTALRTHMDAKLH